MVAVGTRRMLAAELRLRANRRQPSAVRSPQHRGSNGAFNIYTAEVSSSGEETHAADADAYTPPPPTPPPRPQPRQLSRMRQQQQGPLKRRHIV